MKEELEMKLIIYIKTEKIQGLESVLGRGGEDEAQLKKGGGSGRKRKQGTRREKNGISVIKVMVVILVEA